LQKVVGFGYTSSSLLTVSMWAFFFFICLLQNLHFVLNIIVFLVVGDIKLFGKGCLLFSTCKRGEKIFISIFLSMVMKLMLVAVLTFILVVAGISLVFVLDINNDSSSTSEEVNEYCLGKNPKTCVADYAIEKEEPSICENINEYYVNLCNDDAEEKGLDSTGCEYAIGTDQFLVGNCYVEVAKSMGDSKICDKIDNLISQGSCYFEVAGITGDLSLCKKISKEADQYVNGLIHLCYGKVGVVNNDISVCDNSEEVFTFIWRCYSELAIGMNDDTICSRITDKYESEDGINYADLCYMDVARAFRDASICEKIRLTKNNYKQECLSRVETTILNPHTWRENQ
jgi:hypothetical protein